MAVSTVYLDDRGGVRKFTSGNASYEAARVASRGSSTTNGSNAYSSNLQSTAFGIQLADDRGVTKNCSMYRAYFSFDIGAIIGSDTVSALVLNVFGYANGGGNFTVVKANSNASFGTIATTDYPNVFNGSTSQTAYSSNITAWNVSGAIPSNQITLNSTAISNVNTLAPNTYLTIGLVNQQYDFSNGAAVGVTTRLNGCRFDTTGVYRAHLTVTHDSSGYTNPINGTTVQYNKVNGVSASTIEKINGRIGG